MQIAVECSRDLDWDICMYKRLCLGPSDWHRKTASLNSGNNSILGYLQLIEECLVPGNSIILSCYCTAGVRFPFHAFFDTVRSHSDVVLISSFNATRKEDCCCFSIWKHVLSPGVGMRARAVQLLHTLGIDCRQTWKSAYVLSQKATHPSDLPIFISSLSFASLWSFSFLIFHSMFLKCNTVFLRRPGNEDKERLVWSTFCQVCHLFTVQVFLSLSSHFSSNSSFARINSQTTCLSFWEQILYYSSATKSHHAVCWIIGTGCSG